MNDEDDDSDSQWTPSTERASVAIPPELERKYRTAEVSPLSGEARVVPEDFLVEEVPLYEPAGEGEHLYVTIEKRGIPTFEAIRRLARALDVRERDVGHAGLKDARAVTRQTLSFQFASEEALARFRDDKIQVLAAKRHRNKLKLGHLKGNRFRLRIRGVAPGDDSRAREGLDQLARVGAPNYFGLQRFGYRFDTHRLGLALVREDAPAFVETLLGSLEKDTSPALRAAGEAYRAGEFAKALATLPPSHQAERAALDALRWSKGDTMKAARAVPLRWRRFYASALQSLLFNGYLTRQISRLDTLEVGEIAYLHRNGAAFTVEDAAREAPRVAALEISPSGPLFGRKLLRPAEGTRARADEDAVLAEQGLGSSELGDALGSSPKGERRSLRLLVAEPSVGPEGDSLVLSFFLPRGSYATVVLEELFKRPVV
jgi:tRNA pseudouridine13 synthase